MMLITDTIKQNETEKLHIKRQTVIYQAFINEKKSSLETISIVHIKAKVSNVKMSILCIITNE